MSKLANILANIIVTVCVIGIILIVGWTVLVMPSEILNKYANAPDCNGTIPQTEGICKWSNRTWILCEKPILSDVHLKNTVWCKPVELFDVTT